MMGIFTQVLAIILFWNPAQAKQLVFGSNENSLEQEIAEYVFKKLADRLEIEVKVMALPPARSNQMNIDSLVEGEIARIFYYGEKYPQLHRVKPAYYQFTTEGFCLKSRSLKVSSYQDFRKYRVAVIRGVMHSLVATKDHPNVVTVSNSRQMFELVKAGRVDLAIDNGLNGGRVLQEKGFQEIRSCGIAAKLELFIYMNPRNRQLAEKFSKEIAGLKKSGKLQIMIQEAESKIFNKVSKFYGDVSFLR